MTKGEVLKQVLKLGPVGMGVAGLVYMLHLWSVQSHETELAELKLLEQGIPVEALACRNGATGTDAALCAMWIEGQRNEE